MKNAQITPPNPPSYEVTMREKRVICDIFLHPLPSHQGLFVQITPPDRPTEDARAWVDIVLVIDVSTSMSESAPMPRGPSGEKLPETGFSYLDLVKHAANAVLETLNEHDRLSIVTFSTTAETVQPLSPMTKANKDIARRRIKSLVAGGCTNLWGGIRQGLAEFDRTEHANVRAALVLTDGRPYGHGSSPSTGWVHAFERLGCLPAAVHTFGFGYDLQDGLLQSIAELGGGNYSFISDIGMIGNTMAHAVANVQCTFAEDVSVVLRCPDSIGLEESWLCINHQKESRAVGNGQYTFNLHSIQYGQTVFRYLWYRCGYQQIQSFFNNEKGGRIEARLDYTYRGVARSQSQAVFLERAMESGMSESDIAYHLSRAQVAGFISRLFPLDPTTGEHRSLSPAMLPKARENLGVLLRDIRANSPAHRHDPRCQALIADLHIPPDGKGQVEQALDNAQFQRWGKLYLPSLLCAYVHQCRLSFKEPGTKFFGGSLFSELVDAVSDAFDNLPSPEPTIAPARAFGRSSPSRKFAMRLLNDSSNDCFAGTSYVLLASQETIQLRDLRPGMEVQTLSGPQTVKAVIKCHTNRHVGRTMCEVTSGAHPALCVTPWHPISLDGGRSWVFPAALVDEHGESDNTRVMDRYLKDVYSALLERRVGSSDPDACSIMVNGVWGLTLGHGLTRSGNDAQGDIRNHPFYGDYDAVVGALEKLPRDAEGRLLIDGCKGPRNESTGLVSGYRAFEPVSGT